jgi:hypothetical protein
MKAKPTVASAAASPGFLRQVAHRFGRDHHNKASRRDGNRAPCIVQPTSATTAAPDRSLLAMNPRAGLSDSRRW